MARRVLRPTGRGFSKIDRPIRPFAHQSPLLPLTFVFALDGVAFGFGVGFEITAPLTIVALSSLPVVSMTGSIYDGGKIEFMFCVTQGYRTGAVNL